MKKSLLSLLRAFWVPLLMAGLAFLLLREPIVFWLQGDEKYDQDALTEWVREARVHQTLPELTDSFMQSVAHRRDLQVRMRNADHSKRPPPDELRMAEQQIASKREQLEVHLQSMCDPVTKVYPGRLPLFVNVYRMTIRFDDGIGETPIVWDSGKPRQPTQFREMPPIKIHKGGVWVEAEYTARVFARQQFSARQAVNRWRWLSGLGLLLLAVASVWFFVRLQRQRDRELRRFRAEQQASEAERLRLQEALKRQEAERRREDAERTALELKSQLFANIGIMAGSYAHNIKNLLVRPNDLLERCLEQDGLSAEHGHMLHEVRQTLGTVTERLQQILQTVRRDPSQSENKLLDLNALAREMCQTWTDMAHDKWKMDLTLELAGGEGEGEGEHLRIDGDGSHLQQALENLLFNARDATFEMRNHLRELRGIAQRERARSSAARD